MNYIRTKDGRIFNLIAYKEDGEINGGIRYTSKLNGSCLFIQKDNILKQADTIKELCDEFVLVITPDDGEKWGVLMPYDDFKNLPKYPENDYYGAIWTDKGLIYKAKKKGVLPNGEIDWELL